MTRVVSLFLPTWPTDRVRRADGAPSPEAPLVLCVRVAGQRRVHAADAAARAAGLRTGMALTEARIRVPGLVVREADPDGDAEALTRLAIGLLARVSPVVAADPPDGILIETSGADHLHGGEAALLTALVERLARSGVAARAAIADTLGTAHGLARCTARPTCIAPPGHGPELLAALPPEALRIPAPLAADLRLLGFTCIGDLLARPRAPLVRRFGPDFGRRLDEATGARGEPVEPVQPPELVSVRRAFVEPISAPETIARHAGRLVERLCTALEERSLGARQVDLLCRRLDGRLQALRIGLARPARDAKRIRRLFGEKLATLDPGFGIEEMTLAASVAEPLTPQQTVSALAGETAPDLSALVDTLANRVGSDAIYRVAPVESDVPERSVCRVAPLAPPAGTGWPAGWPRPARLLPRPERIETLALLPDHPPVAFTWRGLRHRVIRADGPERIFGEWWKRDAERDAVRDYFRVEDATGARYWIFRAGDGEHAGTGPQTWFLHGIFG